MIIYDKELMTDVSAVGGKGVGLAKLTAYGLNVPDFFVIAAGTDINDARFAAELDGFAANLNCDRFAVRSSCVNEDAEDGSFAGQFSTILYVSRDELLQAVKNVVSSGLNKRAKKYSKHFAATSGKIAVVVQKQLYGDYSGVMFTTSPYDAEEIIIESVRGACENLVGGITSPDEKVFKKGEACVDVKYGKLLKVADMLERKEGYPLDIEWTFCNGTFYFLQMRPLTAVGDDLPTFPDRRWNMYVYRDFCLFSRGIQRIASCPQVQEKQFGFSVPISECLIINGREFYSPESDAKANAIWESLDKGTFFEKFIENIKECVKVTRSRVDILKKLNCACMDTSQLFLLYEQEIKAYIESYVPLMMRPDDYLYLKLIALVGEERAEELARAAAISNKKTYYANENFEFLSAVACGNVADYLDKYEWTGAPLGRECVTIDGKYFSRRAAGLTPEMASEKLRKKLCLQNKEIEYRDKVISELGDKERILFNRISEFIYLRTYTAENSDRYFYYIRKNIFEAIANRMQIDMDILLLMSPEELRKAESGFRLSAREISKRKSGEVIVISDGGSSVYYTGRSYNLLKKLLPAPDKKVAALTGKIACAGQVRAKVKIINNIRQADDFEEGSILVTTMTVPEITFAIEKASGIITDEGGITCHAAIIAREYAVPCLVGTKNATSVLKNGDIVNLDCVNGRVIIEK